MRRFNRVVTQRVGALDEAFLARGRSLGQARVLWEVGTDGCDVRLLRSRLDLDSGYLSRLLRALEADGLITVEVHGTDARVRKARLTRAGRRERAELNRRADELASSILDPLTPGQRDRLVVAMAEVERLFIATMVEISVVDPAEPSARFCVRSYFDELAQRFDGGFDPARSLPADDEQLREPVGVMLMATMHEDPVGCGAVIFHQDVAELKRMWVSTAVRGLGLGRRLLTELERRAAGHGARTVRLETNGALAEAIALYRSSGYYEVERFSDEPYAQHWFEKAGWTTVLSPTAV
jgi:DNA-binding MarR family transcriptional regulator/N-acetylglutamate synthase-like GNAT family acetyltransferase